MNLVFVTNTVLGIILLDILVSKMMLTLSKGAKHTSHKQKISFLIDQNSASYHGM